MVQKQYNNNIISVAELSQMRIAHGKNWLLLWTWMANISIHIDGRTSEMNSKDKNLDKQKLMETLVLAPINILQ